MLRRIRSNIDTGTIQEAKSSKNERLRIGRLYWLSGVAAVILVALSVTFFEKSNVSTSAEQVTVRNLSGSMYKVTLSDSSTVWLSPNSKLQYPKSFSGNDRQVSMDGEAFFEVSEDPKHPFIVSSGEVITKVLGTSFRVRAYQNSKSTEVSVVTGKVAVSILEKNLPEVTILPSYKVTYQKDSDLLEKNLEEKSSSMRMWEKTTMSFENVLVSEVIDALNQKFDVRIGTKDEEIREYVLNADFTDQSLPAILEILERSLDITYTIDDKKIQLNKK